MQHLSDDECVEAVQEALDSLPAEMLDRLGNVAIVVEERHPEGLMGIYDPTGGLQRIVIFRDANPSRDEIHKTVLHEVGHFFGMNEERLRKLGYG